MNDGVDRRMWKDFHLHNKHLDSGEKSWTWHGRPPLFVFGSHTFSAKLGADQTVINLPLVIGTLCSLSLETVLNTLLSIIKTYQSAGPYLLAGVCDEGYFAYEIARRLAASGQEVGLLALIECTGVGHRGWVRTARILLFSVTYPTAVVSAVGRTLKGLKDQAFGTWEAREERSSNVELVELYHDHLNKLFRDYKIELDQGRAPYRGSLVLIFGDRSMFRFLPAWGWRRLVRGKIEILVVSGDHYERLFAGESLARELRMCIDKTLCNYTGSA